MTDSNSKAASTRLPFVASDPPLTRSTALKHRPGADLALLDPLALIWDEVVHRIVGEMMDMASADQSPLHIHLREEMIFELANLQIWLAEAVVKKRLGDREIDAIELSTEREECLGTAGSTLITGTAKLTHERIWAKRMNERWKPKSLRQIERDANPRKTVLSPKPVNDNHFIPKWFIRDHWSTDGRILRWRRENGVWTSKKKGFAEWGYRQNLYSDRREAYFSLIDGDAKAPIEMLLDTRPLNDPQRDALVGFLIIGILRSPFLVEHLRTNLASLIAEHGLQDDPRLPSDAYDTLYSNNEFYDKLARPVRWSQWALVKATSPVFVLPDTFCVRADTGDGMRLIAPLDPFTCFVTLPSREKMKSLLPHRIKASDELASRISALLVASAESEFISHRDFSVNPAAQPVSLADLLRDIEAAVTSPDR